MDEPGVAATGARIPTFATGTREPSSNAPLHHTATGISQLSTSSGDAAQHHHQHHIARFGLRKNTKLELIAGKEHSASRPFGIRHLLGRPRIRQWIVNRRVYREVEAREVDRFELLFDLVIVSAAHVLAEAAMEELSGITIARFILTFLGVLSIWQDMRRYMNCSGHDDMFQRLNLMATMALVVGFASNASAITIEHSESGGFEFGLGGQSATNSAFGFMSIAVAMRICRNLVYTAFLPNFRLSHLATAAEASIVFALILPIVFTSHLAVATGLLVSAICVELFGRLCPVIFLSLRRRMADVGLDPSRTPTTMGNGTFRDSDGKIVQAIPAINIEHWQERNDALVVIVLGELILSVTQVASTGTFGLSAEYGRAALAILLASSLAALYFANALTRAFVHAARRHYASQTAHTLLHIPLTISLLLLGAAAGHLVEQEDAHDGYQWAFAGGSAVALLSLAGIGWMHGSLDAAGSAVINRHVRLSGRLFGALICALIPLASHLRTTTLFGSVTAVCVFLYFFEQFGKLGAYVLPEDQDDPRQIIQPLAYGRDGETEKEAHLADQVAEGQLVAFDKHGHRMRTATHCCDGGRDAVQVQMRGLA